MATSLEPLPPITHVRNFQVEVPGLSLVVGFFTQVTGFSTQVDVLEYPEGGRNDFVHRLPSRAKQGNLTLKRGVTGEKALLQWFQKTVVEVQPENLSITLFDSTGKRIQTWSFRNAYPVKWTGSDLNAGGTEFLTESLEIAHNGMAVQ
jgi:phage tail-like protein